MQKKLKTVNIKGKEYVEVSERLRCFREEYAKYTLETEVIELNDKVCVLKAIIKNEEGRIVATGLAREVNGSTYINKTSYVENAETSAWGRALGNLGIGIEGSVASALEATNAVKNQHANFSDDSDEARFCQAFNEETAEMRERANCKTLDELLQELQGVDDEIKFNGLRQKYKKFYNDMKKYDQGKQEEIECAFEEKAREMEIEEN